MEFTWLMVLSGLVVIPVVMTIEQDHVEGALAPRSGLIGTDRIGDACGGASAEPGGILFGPF
jgi:hypothetical protein